MMLQPITTGLKSCLISLIYVQHVWRVPAELDVWSVRHAAPRGADVRRARTQPAAPAAPLITKHGHRGPRTPQVRQNLGPWTMDIAVYTKPKPLWARDTTGEANLGSRTVDTIETRQPVTAGPGHRRWGKLEGPGPHRLSTPGSSHSGPGTPQVRQTWGPWTVDTTGYQHQFIATAGPGHHRWGILEGPGPYRLAISETRQP